MGGCGSVFHASAAEIVRPPLELAWPLCDNFLRISVMMDDSTLFDGMRCVSRLTHRSTPSYRYV
jgi:hypothetical protein